MGGGHKIFDHQMGGGHKNIAEVLSEFHDPLFQPKKMVAPLYVKHFDKTKQNWVLCHSEKQEKKVIGVILSKYFYLFFLFLIFFQSVDFCQLLYMYVYYPYF